MLILLLLFCFGLLCCLLAKLLFCDVISVSLVYFYAVGQLLQLMFTLSFSLPLAECSLVVLIYDSGCYWCRQCCKIIKCCYFLHSVFLFVVVMKLVLPMLLVTCFPTRLSLRGCDSLNILVSPLCSFLLFTVLLSCLPLCLFECCFVGFASCLAIYICWLFGTRCFAELPLNCLFACLFLFLRF